MLAFSEHLVVSSGALPSHAECLIGHLVRISYWNLNMVKAWTALHGQTLINLLGCRFKMSIVRQLYHIFIVRQVFSESL